jgi:hypothetical protein
VVVSAEARRRSSPARTREIFAVNWSTALQEQIPPTLLSRVSAYDALGSFALTPIGAALAGPIALTIGTTATLAGAATLIIVSAAAVLSVPEVRSLTRRTSPAPDDRVMSENRSEAADLP